MDLQTLIDTLDFSSIAWEIITPLIFSLFDILTGFIQAVINKNVDSGIMRKGLLHKLLLLIIICSAVILDKAFNLPYVTKIVSIYIIVMEITSILENLKKAGIEVGDISKILIDKEEKKWNFQKKI